MRYVANRVMNVTLQGETECRRFKPGDAIPDFGAWPPQVQQSLLNTHHVKLDLDFKNYVSKDDADGLRAALSALGAPPVAELPVPQDKLAEPQASAEPAADDDGEDAAPNDADKAVACEMCSRVFASARALKTHRTKIHGGL